MCSMNFSFKSSSLFSTTELQTSDPNPQICFTPNRTCLRALPTVLIRPFSPPTVALRTGAVGPFTAGAALSVMRAWKTRTPASGGSRVCILLEGTARTELAVDSCTVVDLVTWAQMVLRLLGHPASLR